MKSADSRRQIELRNDMDSILNNAEYNFSKDPALKVRTALLRAQASEDMGDQEEARRLSEEAQRRNAALSQPLQLERERLTLSGDPVPVLEPEPEHDSAREAPRQVRRDPEMSDKVNRLGVKHYLAGKGSQAIRYFGLAIEYDPGNVPALLNLAQLFLEVARDQEAKRDERLKMVDRYLRLTDRLPLEAVEKLRQSQLKTFRRMPLSELPEGSLGVLLR
jgi:tetratricopeptide (TPR) repeat protein